MSRTRRRVVELLGGPLDGMWVPAGPGRTLLVPVCSAPRIAQGASTTDCQPARLRLIAEYSRSRIAGPFAWVRWSPRSLD
jgi:hypothetical protein